LTQTHVSLPSASAVPLRRLANLSALARDHGQLLVTATIRVDAADPYMEGHFPGFPIYPGVFVLETVNHAVGAALAHDVSSPPTISHIGSMRFLIPLLDGDEFALEASVTPARRPGSYDVDAACRRLDGSVAARIKLTLRGQSDHVDA
jgi:3-hydroxyacyl-[acyl-carrier-protein] dehydratase